MIPILDDFLEEAYAFVEESFENGYMFIALIVLFVILIWILLRFL